MKRARSRATALAAVWAAPAAAIDAASVFAEQVLGFGAVLEPHADILQDCQGGFVHLLELIRCQDLQLHVRLPRLVRTVTVRYNAAAKPIPNRMNTRQDDGFANEKGRLAQ